MATWRARKTLKLGPRRLHYFRRYAATANGHSARGGFTSHGIYVHVPLLGPLTVNLTRRTWTWDNPGAGSVTGSWGRAR